MPYIAWFAGTSRGDAGEQPSLHHAPVIAPTVRGSRRWIALAGSLSTVLLFVCAGSWARGFEHEPLRLTLEQAIDLALLRHPAIRIQREAAEADHARVGVARTAYLPSIDLSAQVNYGTGNVLRGPVFSMPAIPSVSGAATGHGLTDAAPGVLVGVGVSWDVLSLVVAMADVDAALAVERRAQAALALTRFEVAYSAGDQFLDLLARKETVRSLRASVERARVFATIVHALVDQQLRPGADGDRADAELALASTRLIEGEQAEAVSRDTLARALGIADRELGILPGMLLGAPPADLRPSGAQNPLLVEATAGVRSAEAQRRAVALTWMPRLALVGALWDHGSGLDSVTAPPSPGAGFVPDAPNAAVGILLDVSIRDIVTARERERVEAALVRRREAVRDDVVQALETQLRVARDTVAGARRVAANTPIQLAAARATEAQAMARYRSGLATVVEVAEAERLLVLAEIDDTVARVNVWRALLLAARAKGDLSPFVEAVVARGQ